MSIVDILANIISSKEKENSEKKENPGFDNADKKTRTQIEQEKRYNILEGIENAKPTEPLELEEAFRKTSQSPYVGKKPSRDIFNVGSTHTITLGSSKGRVREQENGKGLHGLENVSIDGKEVLGQFTDKILREEAARRNLPTTHRGPAHQR